jgi:mannose-1-phosphate guanylyltransferase/mannose-6-phosphate isomerase
MLLPIILCGGSGTRLWPLSRAKYPKQLLALTGGRTLLQQALERARAVAKDVAPMVICNEEHRFLVAEQAREIDVPVQIVLEPEGRNTAPAAELAVELALAENEDALILILAADHLIGDTAAFVSTVRMGVPLAARGSLVTFGVTPDCPHTGYGYIRKGEPMGAASRVAEFVEKPDRERAEAYLSSGEYLWNSGMFLFDAGVFRDELAGFAPAIVEQVAKAAAGAQRGDDFVRLDEDAFRASPSDSIDYAVMEKTDKAAVLELAVPWSDLGSWSAVRDALPRDEAGNALVGDALAVNCRDSLLFSTSRLVTGVGLYGHAVIETKDAVMVVPLDDSEAVKRAVEALKNAGRGEVDLHRQVFRPWGSYDSTDQDEGFQVKRLVVKPGAQLSLQMHHRRAEHWVVVQGRGRITRDDEVYELGVNESTFIPLGAKHRIENPGDEELVIVEVQCGDYLGEDDIVRFEDRYGREGTVG